MLQIGIIGYGYWGPNLVRNFSVANGSQVSMVCDMNKQSLSKAKKAYPQVRFTSDVNELIKDPEVNAVAIATPVFTHFELAKKAFAHTAAYDTAIAAYWKTVAPEAVRGTYRLEPITA